MFHLLFLGHPGYTKQMQKISTKLDVVSAVYLVPNLNLENQLRGTNIQQRLLQAHMRQYKPMLLQSYTRTRGNESVSYQLLYTFFRDDEESPHPPTGWLMVRW